MTSSIDRAIPTPGTDVDAVAIKDQFNAAADDIEQLQEIYSTIAVASHIADYGLSIDDAGTTLLHPSTDATARTFTIPANSSVAFPVGTALTFVNQNAAGSLTIAITSDTMRLAGSGATGSRTLAANGIATALKISTTEWIINGANLT